jgi:hypothetical protein
MSLDGIYSWLLVPSRIGMKRADGFNRRVVIAKAKLDRAD